jgi:hypothetical protein
MHVNSFREFETQHWIAAAVDGGYLNPDEGRELLP